MLVAAPDRYRLNRSIFFHQVRALTYANLKTRYRKTFAGFLWVVLNPLIMFYVQSQVFGHFLHLNVTNYSLFLISGLLPWIFINQTLEMSIGIFVNFGRLLKAFPVHPMVYLVAQLLDNLLNFLAAFLIILFPVIWYQKTEPLGLLLAPLAFFPLALGTLGIAWFLATLHVFFRDTRFVMSFVMGIAFYLTPVFYSSDFFPADYRWLMTVNPFFYLIDPFHQSLYEFHPAAFWIALGKAWILSLSFLLIAALYWKRKRNAVFFYV